MKLIVGLGNPGPQYEQTRHNAGFRVVDKLAAKHGWKWNERRSRAVLASGTIGTEKVILAKPLTFMNLSGEAVGDLLRWYKLPLEDLLVIYDELDLPPGKVRLRSKGSAAGHNGLDSIVHHLHTNEFPRLRIGIGRPANRRMDTIHYVLGIPPTDERITLSSAEDRALEAVEMLLTQGIEATMNAVNTDPEAQQKAEEKRRRQQERQEQARLHRQATAIAVGMNARLFPNNWRPAREEVAFARAHGFHCLQFPGPEQGLDAARLGDPLDVIARALSVASMTAVMEIAVRVDASGHTEAGTTILDVLQANLPAITTLSCTRVHLHLVPSRTMESRTLRALEKSLVPQFREGIAIARIHNFLLGFEHNEPVVGLFAEPEPCATLLSDVPGLGFVWDFNHTLPEDLPAYLELAPRMTMLHVSDTPLPELNYHLPLGMGSIDIAAYCRALIERGFRGPAILEIGGLPKSGGYGRDTDEALIDSCQRLQEAIAAAML